MKRKVLILLCVCLLLSACQTPVQTTDPTTEPIIPTTQTMAEPLLEQGRILEESPNILYIPSDVVEDMMPTGFHLLGNDLLLSQFEANGMALKLLSLKDGSLSAEAVVSVAPATALFIGNGRIGLCDRMSGKVTILDDHLQTLQTYRVNADGDDWYLDPELDTLYIFSVDRGLLSVELETGEESWLVDNGFRVVCKGMGADSLLFSFVNREDQMTYNRCLTMSTGALEHLPADDPILEGTRHGNTWFMRSAAEDGAYTLVHDGVAASFHWSDSDVRLLPQRQELMVADPSGRNLTIYGIDGSFRSTCALPQNSENFVASELLWSDYWGGYFFADFVDSSCRLMFWDVRSDSTGESLEVITESEIPSSEPLLEAGLYERAAELSQRFGVEILIGEQCALSYTTYLTEPLTDPQLVSNALYVLEDALSQYPDGFISQLRHNTYEMIRIELVSDLVLRDAEMNKPTNAAGFAQPVGNRYLVVLEANDLYPETVYHEMAHIISARLEWDSLIREDAIFSDEDWMALQPEGFQYAMVYSNLPDEYVAYVSAGYFINMYSMSFATEDRSELMSEAMALKHWLFEPGTGRREKLQFYADCIRDCFDTTDWPETTRWERVLR